jgi:hypothetical protein
MHGSPLDRPASTHGMISLPSLVAKHLACGTCRCTGPPDEDCVSSMIRCQRPDSRTSDEVSSGPTRPRGTACIRRPPDRSSARLINGRLCRLRLSGFKGSMQQGVIGPGIGWRHPTTSGHVADKWSSQQPEAAQVTKGGRDVQRCKRQEDGWGWRAREMLPRRNPPRSPSKEIDIRRGFAPYRRPLNR